MRGGRRGAFGSSTSSSGQDCRDWRAEASDLAPSRIVFQFEEEECLPVRGLSSSPNQIVIVAAEEEDYALAEQEGQNLEGEHQRKGGLPT